MEPISDQELVHGIKHQDREILEYMYTTLFPSTRQMIKQQGGTDEDANDIFQDGLLVLFRNIQMGKYEQRRDVKLSTYFIQVCKYKWYDILKKRKRQIQLTEEQVGTLSDGYSIQKELEMAELHKKIHAHLQQLGERCQKILKLFYWEEKSMSEIGALLQMEEASVKNGKYRCMQKLRDRANDLLP